MNATNKPQPEAALEWIPVEPELPGVSPKYLPGDIVKTASGRLGVIVEAQVIVGGWCANWNETVPGTASPAQLPSYALDLIPGYPSPGKHAWWESSEWSEVVLGPLHLLKK